MRVTAKAQPMTAQPLQLAMPVNTQESRLTMGTLNQQGQGRSTVKVYVAPVHGLGTDSAMMVRPTRTSMTAVPFLRNFPIVDSRLWAPLCGMPNQQTTKTIER